MHDEGIPIHVAAFIVDHISSVVQLEVLLLLLARRASEATADDLSRELRVNADWVITQMQPLCDTGILAVAGGRYQYRPKSSDIDQTVQDLARTYNERRVSVITLIFNKPTGQVQSFADAFRIRRNGGNG